MDGANDSRQRGSEDLWLDAAYGVLTTAGVEAVKVMPLAKMLGLTRTSFYWHFKDRDALLEAMVQRWERRNTGTLVARCEAFAASVSEAMLNVFDCWLNPALFDSRLDLAIRNWARTDPALQARLDRADAARSAAMAAMFRRFGFPEVQAQVRAQTVLYTQIGYISMQVREDAPVRVGRMPDWVEVFTDQRPSEDDFNRFLSRNRAVIDGRGRG